MSWFFAPEKASAAGHRNAEVGAKPRQTQLPGRRRRFVILAQQKRERRSCAARHNRRYAHFGIMRSPQPRTACLWGFSWSCSAHNHKPFKNCTISSARGRDDLRTWGGSRQARACFFDFQVGIQVLVGRLGSLVAEPHGNYRQVHPRLKQVHCSRVPNRVGRDSRGPQRRMFGCRPFHGQSQIAARRQSESWACHGRSAATANRGAVEFPEPGSQHLDGLPPKRDRTILATFPADMNRHPRFQR